jgi:hypothetical protein
MFAGRKSYERLALKEWAKIYTMWALSVFGVLLDGDWSAVKA